MERDENEDVESSHSSVFSSTCNDKDDKSHSGSMVFSTATLPNESAIAVDLLEKAAMF
jgi:hypothetical protein